MASEENAVFLRNACLSYGKGEAASMILDHLNMSVPKGSIYGLLGASGCGKTTLLSCIAGRLKLDEGEVRVLGGIPGTKGSGVPGPRIGYMPQEIALVNEMDVGNVIFYFGWLFGMSSPQIAERYAFLTDLLELPDSQMLVKNLSGGQQRRVSFAAALIQSPELMILDEPTVGLDPILRQNIWDYLVQISRDMDMTIIITTHYIEEATQAHKIGLMREGTLLADMAPDVLIAKHSCTTLEEVFLKLSQIQGNTTSHSDQMQGDANDVPNSIREEDTSSPPITEHQEEVINSSERRSEPCHQENEIKIVTLDKITSFRRSHKYNPSFTKRLQALMYKDSLAILRNTWGILLMFIFPVVQMTLFFPTVGNDPQGIAIGIVNDEIANCHDLIGDIRKNSSVFAENYDNGTCHFHGLSCLFIDKLKESSAKKIYFSDTRSALAATKKSITSATIYFPSHFSSQLEERVMDALAVSNDTIEKSQIKVWLDMSSYLIGFKLQALIYDTYQSLSEDVAVGCNLHKRTHEIPVLFKEPVYGSTTSNYREFMVAGYIMAMVFFLCAIETATVLTTERSNGVWIRNLVAGVSASESVLSHILCQVTGIIVQMCEILLIVFYVFNMECKGNMFSVIGIVFLQCVAGTAYGLLVGSFFKNTTNAMYATIGSFLPYFLIMGTIWPLEGAHKLLQYVSYCSPGTLASNSLRNIMNRGWGIMHHQVYPGYIMSIFWIIGQFAVSVWILRKKI